ncbi:MAG: formate dehydrogenase accessory sulfurtransferase FdhD [Burkholderiales bacterium]|nr:formate dehydrogenase accessory sulfurtransferase FdhD [Burkholderiales bacterium]
MPNAATTERNAYRWTSRGGIESELNLVAEEVPLALIYNGEPFSVMMVSPADLENFVVGFSLTENIVSVWQDIGGVEFVHSDKGIAAYISVDKKSSDALSKRKKNLVGRTGCGICGEETLEATLAKTKQVTNTTRFDNFAIQRAITSLSDTQVMNHGVGTFHGAAWADCAGDIVCVREDVGRHNALDKLIGVMCSELDKDREGFVLITSRASYEMVSKVAVANIGLLVAVSGPTSLAINTAIDSDVTLIGFARGGRQTIYTHEQRIIM